VEDVESISKLETRLEALSLAVKSGGLDVTRLD
jgi:hypothetical protein